MMSNEFRTFFEKYLTRKIGVEIKCCVMFFMLLCFYAGYKLICGFHDANIFHMIEMVMLAYILGWIQMLIGSDFDEVDRLNIKDWFVVIGGSAIYSLVSFAFSWFERNIVVTLIFAVYMVIAYLGIFLIHTIKRAIDAKLLNNDLKKFKQRDNKEC
ncbi:MAG: DUF3021 family protein [Acutalibacteraceae bacterium]|nr:DUF3021 family protein [Acutalibacteraceae bacterium]